MSAIDKVTESATESGWTVDPESTVPGKKDRTYRKGEMVFLVRAHPAGTVSIGILDCPEGRRVIKGKHKTARIIGTLKSH